jgi:tRNA/tmRNA/rRNA uracil-C5-methylase (TrmA/RlmC/RlmD family)
VSQSWLGERLTLRLGNPGHGGFCVARHEGRVVFVRHGLPGESVRALVTEDRGGAFCRADAVQVLAASPDRVPSLCPVSGPGGAGCCDFSHVRAAAQRALKATVVAEQLWRIAKVDRDIEVLELPGGDPATGGLSGWRTRIGLAVDAEGRAGVHRHHSSEVIADLRCPQPVAGAMDGIAEARWTPGGELRIAVDGAGVRHVTTLDPARRSHTARTSPGRRGAAARRAASAAPRRERVVAGTGRATEAVAGRVWEIGVTDFWQAHRGAAQRYSDVVADWAELRSGEHAVDLYSGAGVFAARLAEQVGQAGEVVAVESAASAVAAGVRALADLPQLRLRAGRAERTTATLPDKPGVVVLDPPRAGAGREVVSAITARMPRRVIHIGCDPAAFARDVALYSEYGYRLADLQVFDAFPLTHHVECLGLFHM